MTRSKLVVLIHPSGDTGPVARTLKAMNEEARLEALQSYQVLDTLPEDELDELAEIASVICDTPIALITFLDDHRQWFKARIGLKLRETPREYSFCRYALDQPNEVLVIEDSRRDQRVADNPLVTGDPNIRFYAGAPLRTPEGGVLGTLCVLDRKPRKIGEKQKKALQLLADKAMSFLDTRKVLHEQKERLNLNAAELRRVTDHAPGVLYQFEMTPEGKTSFSFISEGIRRLHPEIDPEKAKRFPALILRKIYPDDRERMRESILRSYKDLSDWYCEYRVISGDGKINWHMGKARPERRNNGTVVWHGTLQNITQHREYEKAMEQISFDISHVLRRPVTTLLGLTAMIEEGNLSEAELKEFSNHIKIVSQELEQFTRKLNETYSLKKEILQGPVNDWPEVLGSEVDG